MVDVWTKIICELYRMAEVGNYGIFRAEVIKNLNQENQSRDLVNVMT